MAFGNLQYTLEVKSSDTGVAVNDLRDAFPLFPSAQKILLTVQDSLVSCQKSAPYVHCE